MSSSIQTGLYEFPCAGPIEVSLRVRDGDVTVTAVDQPVAVVEVSPEGNSQASRLAADQTVVTFTDNTLRVATPAPTGGWLGGRRGRVRVNLSVPIESAVKAELGSADIRTDGPLGIVGAHTGSGDIFIDQASGDVQAGTGSGDVHIGRIGGTLRSTTSSGDVTASEVGGDAAVKVASGDVQLGTVHGALRVTTASGDVRVAAVYGAEVGIDAASGDVNLGVPAGTSVWLDLASVSGSTRSDLTPTGEPERGPALTVRVHTVSGDVRIHRAA